MSEREKISVSVLKKSLPKKLTVLDIVSPGDITMVLPMRAHEDNPWVVERLDRMLQYYVPKPVVLVLDFGSMETFAAELRAVCERHGAKYVHIKDGEMYSPAAAHNRGFEHTETDLVFFCDIDCFGPRDLFKRLADTATSLRMRSIVDQSLILPVFHIGEQDSVDIWHSPDPLLSANLELYANLSQNEEFDRFDNRYTVPYSNIFLVHRHFFSMTGGYDENFRGHGSEDFEYLTRLGIHTKLLPTPKSVARDDYGPLKPEFHNARPYVGFRRMLEAMAYPAESAGLKIFHFFHPRSKSTEWHANNDWKRDRMNQSFAQYLGDDKKLLSVDFLFREKAILCLCKHADQWGYFLPFRAAGYRLVPVYDDSPGSLKFAADQITSGAVKALAIFNPHMQSHSAFKATVMLARDTKLDIAVIERGALPGSIYYADEVSYTSDSFSEDAFNGATYSEEELSSASEYLSSLRSGVATLEAMDSYDETENRLAALKVLKRPVIFIPLQLEEDMAVTMFIKGEQRYPEFVAELTSVIDANPDVLFVIKPHPLSKSEPPLSRANVVVASREDNIHFLLDACTGMACYNSGVGLLALLHGKPVATIGNAFYNVAGAGLRAKSIGDAVAQLVSGAVRSPSSDLVARLAAWFHLRKYSGFIAKDNVRDFGHRKSHGYTDVQVTSFRWNGHDLKLGRQREYVDFEWKSYLSARIGMRHQEVSAPKAVKPVPQPAAQAPKVTVSSSSVAPAVAVPKPKAPSQAPSPSNPEKDARIAYGIGKLDEAIILFDRAISKHPDRPGGYRSLAEILDVKGRTEEAIARLRIADHIAPNPQIRRRIREMSRPAALRRLLPERPFPIPKA